MSAHVITVAQQKGGSGKTTLAIHLATAFAKKGLSTMLFDTDPQGTASHWHAQRKNNDIGLIATSGWRLTRDLAMAKEANDIIIIDTPPHAEMDIKVSTRAADMVIVPLQPSPADLWAVQETMNTVAAESCHAMVVLNRVIHRANITKDIKQKLALLDIPVAKAEIGSRVLFAASMETGMTVLDAFQNPSQREMDELTSEIATIMGVSLEKNASSQKSVAQKSSYKKTKKTAKKKAVSSAKTETKKMAAVKKTYKKKTVTAKKAAPAKKAAYKKKTVKASQKAAPAKKMVTATKRRVVKKQPKLKKVS